MDSPMGADISAILRRNDDWDKLAARDYVEMSSHVVETTSSIRILWH